MENIRILTDSGSDIGLLEAFGYGIEVLPVMYTLNQQPRTQDIDFDKENVYEWPSQGIRITSHSVPSAVYLDRFRDAFVHEATHVIVLCSAKAVAGFYDSALYAKDLFFKEQEQAEMEITVIDSTTCSLPLARMAKKAGALLKAGKDAQAIIEYLREQVQRTESYITLLGTDGMLQKNVTSFLFDLVTDISKVAPILRISGGKAKLLDAQFRSQDALERFIDLLRITLTVKNAPYDILYAAEEAAATELAQRMERIVGYAPRAVEQVGALVVARFGYEFVAVTFEGEKRADETSEI